MARRRSNLVRFPDQGIVITDDECHLLLSEVCPYHGVEVKELLNAAPATSAGRRLAIDHPAINALLDALACEVHGYQKLDDEQRADGGAPKRGSTAQQLRALYERIDGHLA